MDPTMRQLEVFLAVARAGSFRRAAERVHLSQPALSQHVSALERILDARLLDRTGRAVNLTEAGQVLQDHALRVFAALAGAREAIAELGGVSRGSLVVGASTTPGIYLLPAVIGGFEREYPQVAVHLQIANSRVIEERVRANEFDLGVVGGHGLGPGEECLAAGVLDELVLIVPPGHPWAGQRRLDPSRLGQERFLTREEGSASRTVTEQALQHARVRLAARWSSATRRRSSRPSWPDSASPSYPCTRYAGSSKRVGFIGCGCAGSTSSGTSTSSTTKRAR